MSELAGVDGVLERPRVANHLVRPVPEREEGGVPGEVAGIAAVAVGARFTQAPCERADAESRCPVAEHAASCQVHMLPQRRHR
ncbi:hypothetical protein ACFQMM_18585 [Saliphagus sp. GCM10025308]